MAESVSNWLMFMVLYCVMTGDESQLISDVSSSYWKIFSARYSFYVGYYYWMDSM